MNFRRATLEDIPAIFEIRFLVRENVLSDPSKVTPQLCEDYLDRLGRGWVCELDGAIVGFSYAASADGSIWALFVRPGFEGRGIGSRLLTLATDWLFQNDHQQVILSTSINTRADRFYLAKGWQRGAMKNAVEVSYCLPRPRN